MNELEEDWWNYHMGRGEKLKSREPGKINVSLPGESLTEFHHRVNQEATKEKQEVPEKSNAPGMVGQYTFRGGIEPIDFIISNKMGFLEGNVIKYLYRYPFKGGIEALKKARYYLDRLIEVEGK